MSSAILSILRNLDGSSASPPSKVGFLDAVKAALTLHEYVSSLDIGGGIGEADPVSIIKSFATGKPEFPGDNVFGNLACNFASQLLNDMEDGSEAEQQVLRATATEAYHRLLPKHQLLWALGLLAEALEDGPVVGVSSGACDTGLPLSSCGDPQEEDTKEGTPESPPVVLVGTPYTEEITPQDIKELLPSADAASAASEDVLAEEPSLQRLLSLLIAAIPRGARGGAERSVAALVHSVVPAAEPHAQVDESTLPEPSDA